VCNAKLPLHLSDLAKLGAKRGWGILVPVKGYNEILPEVRKMQTASSGKASGSPADGSDSSTRTGSLCAWGAG